VIARLSLAIAAFAAMAIRCGPIAATGLVEPLTGRWAAAIDRCENEFFVFEPEGTFQRTRARETTAGSWLFRGTELTLIFGDGHVYRWQLGERAVDRLTYRDLREDQLGTLVRCPS
jgi:hypothetical protein